MVDVCQVAMETLTPSSCTLYHNTKTQVFAKKQLQVSLFRFMQETKKINSIKKKKRISVFLSVAGLWFREQMLWKRKKEMQFNFSRTLNYTEKRGKSWGWAWYELLSPAHTSYHDSGPAALWPTPQHEPDPWNHDTLLFRPSCKSITSLSFKSGTCGLHVLYIFF